MSTSSESGVRVPAGLHLSSRFFAATAGLWQRLGDLETRVVADEIRDIPIRKPIYVTSLARAGTTIVTELIERHPEVTSHRYSDFPNVWTPYWRNYLLQRSRRGTPAPQERAHRDRIRVSNDSPEAVEEVLWMHFFPDWLAGAGTHVLTAGDRHEIFDGFYQDHIRKLLAVRAKTRYLAKGNYNIARLDYLRSLFPDARFIVPLRDPVSHIASLARQHRHFLAAHREDRRTGPQLAMAGHFEFGPGRRFVRFDDREAADAIARCWDKGLEIEGWARYWAATYRHLADQLESSAALRQALLLISYEDLCNHSESVIDAVLEHCELEPERFAAIRAEFARRLSLPSYYEAKFEAEELAAIEGHCGSVFKSLRTRCHTPV